LPPLSIQYHHLQSSLLVPRPPSLSLLSHPQEEKKSRKQKKRSWIYMVLRFSLGMVRSVPVELAFPFPSPQSPYIYPTISRPEFLSTFLNPLRIFSSSRLPLPICSCSSSYVGGFCVFLLRKRSTSATPWRHSREENPGEDSPPPFLHISTGY
jgi:hypothetical protein